MMDLHVHLRDWSQSGKETVEHGLRTAAMCGIKRVADMPNTSPALTDRSSVLDRLALASPSVRKHRVAYSVYMGLTKDPSQIEEAVRTYNELYPLVLGLKLFAGQSTGNMGIIAEEDQRLVFQTLSRLEYSGVVLVHCEKESLMKKDLYQPGRFETHSLARPAECETESVSDIITFWKESGCRCGLHICHISTAGAIALVKEARAEGLDITCAATAHHALLNMNDAAVHERYLKMNPPLRSEEDRLAVYNGLINGDIDYVESDHAPHTIEDKEGGASGIPGFAGDLILLRKLKSDGVPHSRLEEIFDTAPARRFGLEKSEHPLPDRLDWRIERAAREYPFNPFAGF